MMDHDSYEEKGDFAVDIDGRRYHIPRHCPHRAGRLDHGYVNEKRKTIACPLHHSLFCLETGAQLAGPACGALTIRIQASADEHGNDIPTADNVVLNDAIAS